MNYIVINAGSILAGTVAGLALSIVYRWLSRRPGDLTRVGSIALLATAVVAEFWLARILAGALILAPHEAGPWTMAIGSAVVIWIGFVLPTVAVTETFRGRARSEDPRGLSSLAHGDGGSGGGAALGRPRRSASMRSRQTPLRHQPLPAMLAWPRITMSFKIVVRWNPPRVEAQSEARKVVSRVAMELIGLSGWDRPDSMTRHHQSNAQRDPLGSATGGARASPD